jgi:hypothetical protein
MNFGVLGYSSLQGLQLLEQRVLAMQPQIVLIGFGMNDSSISGYRDKDMTGEAQGLHLGTRVVDLATSSEVYKLLDYFALSLRFKPAPISDYIKDEVKDESDTNGAGRSNQVNAVNYDELEEWTRVSPRDYEGNLREMIRLARSRDASAILLDNELWGGSPYRAVLQRLSTELDVPLVDSFSLIDSAREQTERALETTLHLARAAEPGGAHVDGRVPVVFRVYRGSWPVPKMLSIVGVDPQLGALKPNTVAMRDDGREGDERAGDGVWSYTASLRTGTRLAYVYTNSGQSDTWEGLDVPHIRTVVVPGSEGAEHPAYLPVETFGQIYMQADDWHTNAAGYDVIARTAAEIILRLRPH